MTHEKKSVGSVDLGKWMTKEKLTPEHIAVGVSCTAAYVNGWIRGKQKPGRKMAVRLMDFTGGTVSVESWER